MEQRGPDAHAEGHDAAVIISFRGILVCIILISEYSRSLWESNILITAHDNYAVEV